MKDLSNVVYQAARSEDHEVGIEERDGLVLVVDGVELSGLVAEMFTCDLEEVRLSREAQALTDELLEERAARLRRRRRAREREQTEDHRTAEGADLGRLR